MWLTKAIIAKLGKRVKNTKIYEFTCNTYAKRKNILKKPTSESFIMELTPEEVKVIGKFMYEFGLRMEDVIDPRSMEIKMLVEDYTSGKTFGIPIPIKKLGQGDQENAVEQK